MVNCSAVLGVFDDDRVDVVSPWRRGASARPSSFRGLIFASYPIPAVLVEDEFSGASLGHGKGFGARFEAASNEGLEMQVTGVGGRLRACQCEKARQFRCLIALSSHQGLRESIDILGPVSPHDVRQGVFGETGPAHAASLSW